MIERKRNGGDAEPFLLFNGVVGFAILRRRISGQEVFRGYIVNEVEVAAIPLARWCVQKRCLPVKYHCMDEITAPAVTPIKGEANMNGLYPPSP